LFAELAPSADAAGWKAGSARAVITPKQPTWMAGYGNRTSPSEGTIHDLWCKALVLEDERGQRGALVTLDVCGVGRPLSLEIREALHRQFGLARDQCVLACSHTHTGPVIGTNLIGMYPLDTEQRAIVERYAVFLRETIVQSVARALEQLEPVELAWETGRADFAVNRRANDQAKADALRAELMLQGPVDHDVPVLRVSKADGTLKAVVCGYACHCTTLSLNKFSGDYAGFAQIDLEKAHPGAQAMFVAGCGADQNPLPRGTVEQAATYGTQLAAAVDRVLATSMRPIRGPLKVADTETDLAFGTMPDRSHWESESKSSQLAVANRAKKLLEQIGTEGKLPETYPYPVQVWQLGDGPTWILLGGEVVVDYALRLKRNLGGSHTWVSAYCNDVMAYIPSLRVLKEGGYEGATAMIYYGLPTAWSERVEEQVIDAVRATLAKTNAKH
jgi:hypothetical protein